MVTIETRTFMGKPWGDTVFHSQRMLLLSSQTGKLGRGLEGCAVGRAGTRHRPRLPDTKVYLSSPDLLTSSP